MNEIPHITFNVPFPYALANAAASVIGYVLVRAIYRLVRGSK